MDAGRVVLGVLMVAAGIAFIVLREPLGERARARGAAYGWTLYAAAGVLLLAFGVVTLVAEWLDR